MKAFAEQDPRFEGLERKTGLFLALAAALVLGAFLAALVRQGVFTQTTPLQFFANTAQGISKGMAAQLYGFKVGAVDAVGLETNGSVRVRLQIENEYLRLIPRGSTARLGKEGLIGVSVVEIVPGPAGAGSVAQNETLKFERAGDFSTMAEDLSAQIRPILADLKSLTESINRPDGDIRQMLRNSRQASAELTAAAREWGKLATNADKGLTGVLAKADQAVDKVDSTFAKATATVDRLDASLARMPDLMLKLDRTLSNVEAASADLPQTLRDARAAAHDGRAMIDGAKTTWPFNTMVGSEPAPREQALPLNSFDGPLKPVR
jgi:phospholipid/cholesterol/gamma-HCH transport system substrate-binding protein